LNFLDFGFRRKDKNGASATFYELITSDSLVKSPS